jgi:hypothetical protein
MIYLCIPIFLTPRGVEDDSTDASFARAQPTLVENYLPTVGRFVFVNANLITLFVESQNKLIRLNMFREMIFLLRLGSLRKITIKILPAPKLFLCI